MTVLPEVMAAVNGARKTKIDHPRLPMTTEEITAAAAACFDAGAGAVHAHMRDEMGRHSLDGELYKTLIKKLAAQCPRMLVQITTEAIGEYSPAQQKHLVKTARPQAAAVSLAEMLRDGEAAAGDFYDWCRRAEINIQHIVYSPPELRRLGELIRRGIIAPPVSTLFVLGRRDRAATVEELDAFLSCNNALSPPIDDWMACAFGVTETECLLAAARRGGKIRIGFENNLFNANGKIAADNAERVRRVLREIRRR